MPAIDANANNLLLSSDYPLDKIVYITTGSFVVPYPVAGFTYSINHGLPFIPLVNGSWDVTPSFSTNYNFYTGTVPSSNPAVLFNLELDVSADANNIVILPINVSGSSTIVYYRIYALEPSDSSANISSTASSGDSFVFNLGYNFTKLFKDGLITGVTHPGTYVVRHGLGYPPQVLSWSTDITGTLYPIDYTSWGFGDVSNLAVAVDSTNVTFTSGSTSLITRIDYRIYADTAAT